MAFSRYLFTLNRANHNSIQSAEVSLTDDRAFVSVFTHPLSNIERAIPEIRCTPLKKTWESQNIFIGNSGIPQNFWLFLVQKMRIQIFTVFDILLFFDMKNIFLQFLEFPF